MTARVEIIARFLITTISVPDANEAWAVVCKPDDGASAVRVAVFLGPNAKQLATQLAREMNFRLAKEIKK